MPDAAAAVKLLRAAAMLLRGAPGRQGNLMAPADADDLLVGGDLHGNLGNFRRLVKLADLDHHPRRHLVLQEFVHGPFRHPLGGDASHRLVERAAALALRYPGRVHLLPGNHELAELTGRAIAKDHASLNGGFRAGLEEAYGDAADEVVAALHELFRSLPLGVRTANRILATHSIPPRSQLGEFDPGVFARLGIPLDETERGKSVYALLWGRDVSAAAADAFADLMAVDWLVTGHIACPDHGYARPNPRQWIVDSLGEPAGCVLLPARDSLTMADFDAGARRLEV